MELRHLRYFVAVAEELHFGRAAQRMHVVQPALSQQIQKLERELGVTLLTRTKRRVALTDPGRAFLEEARRTLRSAETAVTAARRAHAGETGHLHVAYVEWVIYLFLPEVLRRYRTRFPQVDLTLTEMHSSSQRDALLGGELDLGFFGVLDEEREFSTEVLSEQPLVAVLPDTHPAAKSKRVPLDALRDDPWVLLPRSMRTRYAEVVLRACAAAGFVPRVAHEVAQLTNVAALVWAGLGVALLPAAFARQAHPRLVVRPLAGRAPVLPHEAVWLEDRLSPTAANFLAVAREVRDASPSTGWREVVARSR